MKRKTTSWDWKDLIDEDEEIIEIFIKKSNPLIIFNIIIFLFIFLLFSPFLLNPPYIINTSFDKIFAPLFIIGIVIYLGGGLINIRSKLIILNKSFIIKGSFFSRKLYFNKIVLQGFILDSHQVIARIPAPVRYFFTIKYDNKEFHYPTWVTSGFPYKLGKEKHEQILNLIKECK